MPSIKELKSDYKTAVYNITSNRYGLESVFFNPRNPHSLGLEDVELELKANEEEEMDSTSETPEGFDDTGMGNDMEDELSEFVSPEGNPDAPAPIDEVSGPEDEFRNMSTDGEMGTDDNGNYFPEDTSEPTWEETNYDDLKSDADCINMVKIVGSYTNAYVANFEQFVKTNPDFIDYSGDLKQNEFYNGFVTPAMDLLEKVFKDDPIIKHVKNYIEVMSDKKIVNSVCGKADSPFLYEGFQIILYDTIRNLLACIPFSVKNNQTLSEVLTSMNLNVTKCLVQMIADVVEIRHMLGTKIFYVAPVVSEITGKSEELANTPYTNLDVMTKPATEGFSRMRYANESIMNLVEIKNNKALVEFAALSKMMLVITGLTKDIEMKNSCNNVLSKVLELTTTDNENLVAMLDESVEYFRNNVFVPEIQAMANLTAEEQAKLTEDPEPISNGPAPEENDIMTAGVEVPGEEIEPETEPMNYDFDNDL